MKFVNKPHLSAKKIAKIQFGDPQRSFDCIILELRDSGAIIQVEPNATAPEKFRLISSALDLNRLCEVIGRQEQKIGVNFIS